MTDWHSEQVEEAGVFAFNQSLLFFLGLFAWHLVLSFKHIEWRLLTLELKFRWVHLPFLVSRYALLATLVTVVIATQSNIIADCRAAIKMVSFLGTLSVACASCNLLIRTLTLWSRNVWVRAFLAFCAVGQLCGNSTLALVSIAVSRTPNSSSCGAAYATSRPALAALYSITVFYDLIVVVFTVVGLLALPRASNSTLWKKLIKHGIAYFVTSLVFNLLVVIMVLLNLNAVMNPFCTVPATVACVISSSLFVISLTEHAEDGSTRSRTARQFFGRSSYRTHETVPAAYSECSTRKSGQLTTNIDLRLTTYRDSGEIREERRQDCTLPTPTGWNVDYPGSSVRSMLA